MKYSTVSYKQSLQNQGGVNYIDKYSFVFTPNLQMIVIIKKGKNVNNAGFGF